MRKSSLVFILLAAVYSFASTEIDIPFEKYHKKMTVISKTGPCSVNDKNKLKLKVEIADSDYQLICKIDDPKNPFESTVRVTALENFKHEKSITKEIANLAPEVIKRQGSKAIHSVHRPWGTQYWWATETAEGIVHTYLCPPKQKTCYKVVYSVKELLEFDFSPL